MILVHNIGTFIDTVPHREPSTITIEINAMLANFDYKISPKR